jgi:hypothetical protein
MAKTSSPLATLIIIALALVLLFALNPGMADFQAWMSGRAERSAGASSSTGLLGVMKKGAGAVAGAMTGLVAGGFQRRDYLLCSTYGMGGRRGSLYLGIAHFFVQLR